MNPLIPQIILTAAVTTAALPAHAENTYTTGRLNNGLVYHILNAPAEKGRVEVQLQVGVGASDENGTSEIGVAHMVEHMVFRRAPDYPDGVGDTLIAQGWRRGANFNAMTNYERTLYRFSPNKGKPQLDDTLKALSAMVSPHRFAQADWTKEQQVIEAEWRNGLGVSERMNRKRNEVLRSGSRQSRHAIIGTQQSIQTTPLSVLQAFFDRWYVADNMQIMLAGDIAEAEAKPLLERYFGRLKTGNLPDRSGAYYEPELVKGWHVAQLQDKDSGGSFVAVLFRQNDVPSRVYGDISGTRERMIDRFAAQILAQRVKNNLGGLPKAVSTITTRKADIGRETVAVGLVASVTPDGHAQGLQEILKLRERILREPVSQAEFDEYMNTMQAAVKRAETKTTLPEPFGDAVQSVSEKAFNGQPVTTQAQNAAAAKPVLAALKPADITARLQQWLNADDKLVQIQAPALTEIKDFPTASEIEAQAGRLKTAALPKLQAKTQAGKGAFADKAVKGKITAESYDKSLKITRWTLKNGDKVVVLQNPVADGKTYLQAYGHTGFMSAGANPWQSQLAQQIVWQSAPQGWTAEQLNEWKKAHKVNLGMSLRSVDSKLEGNAPDKETENLLHLYHAQMTTPQVGEGYRDSIMAMMRRLIMDEGASRAAKDKAVSELRFGGKAYAAPTQTELEETEEAQLLAQWETLSRAPTTYYILTAQKPSKLKPLVQKYLAGIERTPSGAAKPYQALSGAKVERLPVNTENRSDVAAWSFTPYQWSPQTAAQIAILRTLAYEQLKGELRDKALGVYSLKFESTLNPDSNRVESELRFATTPDKADALWRLGESTLAALPQTISEQQVAPLRSQFVEQEKGRLKSPEIWLNRLVLSEQHLGDARYLREMDKLADSLTAEQLRATAKLLWNPQNRRVLIADPMK
ncbi:M16 family metallopeptidase [Neisseria perflava]|uniref:M16 family metallopeptidase n=1 Tax=Neisseria perflava TaxID=33053 RepID=UPI00209D94D4|nr:M16 family metallopeptidase [Neisseria perflava]MCP1661316.1 zinc protease [Neisseria perflava]